METVPQLVEMGLAVLAETWITLLYEVGIVKSSFGVCSVIFSARSFMVEDRENMFRICYF